MLQLILADNQAIFRAGIAKVLAVEDEMRIVAQAQTPEQMFMALDKFRAAVLVVAAMAPILWLVNNHFRMKFSRLTRASQDSFSRVTATLPPREWATIVTGASCCWCTSCARS